MTTKQKIKHILIQQYIFFLTYMFSKLFFPGVYVFQWTSGRYYVYLWLVVLILTWIGQKHIAYSITIANIAGVFIGQYLGDYMVAINEAKITPTMDAQKVYMLTRHRGVYIWMFCVLLSILIGMGIKPLQDFIRSKRKDTEPFQ